MDLRCPRQSRGEALSRFDPLIVQHWKKTEGRNRGTENGVTSGTAERMVVPQYLRLFFQFVAPVAGQ
jgi:hypothetical protein